MSMFFGKKQEEEKGIETVVSDVSENAIYMTDEEKNLDKAEVENSDVVKPEEPKRNLVRVCKVGSDHIYGNKNNHDFMCSLLNMKIVLDGCGSGNHSEIGSRLFAQLFARKVKEFYDKEISVDENNFIDIVNSVFYKMLALCDDSSFTLHNYCFTILVCFEFENEFVVYSAGDGYIIKENSEGITFEELNDGEYPSYYVYNFITDKSILKEYKDGVNFKVNHFSKEEYKNVGVATDGLRYADNLVEVEKIKLMRFLKEGKGQQIEKLINRNNAQNEMFHDDISICF